MEYETEPTHVALLGFGPLAGYLHVGDVVHQIGEDPTYIDETVTVKELTEVDQNKNITITVETEAGEVYTITIPAETVVDIQPPF